MTSIPFHDLRSHFPLLDERAYFDSQSFGPMPRKALEDLDAYRDTLLLRKRAIPHWIGRVGELVGLVETLLNAPRGSVALRDSATAAQAAIAAALTPRAGKDRIVITSLDFHSTRFLWTAQRRRGFEVHEIAAGGAGEISAQQLHAAIDARTALVEAALVSPRTGALLDARALIQAAHAVDSLVVLDAYQAVGAVPIDVQALDADVVVGGTHKWLGGGGMGLSFMYVRPSLAERLEPAYPGWFGHASVMGFGDTYEPAPGAARFQQGSPAIEPVYTARAGLRLVLDTGVDRIRARSLELTGRLIERAESRGLHVRTPRRPEARGPMICIDGIADGDAVVAALEEQGIDIDHRPGAGLRVGPHYCQREEECDRIVDAIAEIVRSS